MMDHWTKIEIAEKKLRDMENRMVWFVVWLDHENNDLNFLTFNEKEQADAMIKGLGDYDSFLVRGDPGTIRFP